MSIAQGGSGAVHDDNNDGSVTKIQAAAAKKITVLLKKIFKKTC